MSLINLSSKGYKGGSRSTPSIQPNPKPIDYVKDILFSFKEYYRTNYLTNEDLTSLVIFIEDIIGNNKYIIDENTSKLSQKIILKINDDYQNKITNINKLTLIKEGISNILLTISPDEKPLIPSGGNSESSITTLTDYKK